MRLKVTKIGNSLGVILPKEALQSLGVDQGDSIFCTESADGLLISALVPEVAHQVKLGQEIAKRYRNTFRELAK